MLLAVAKENGLDIETVCEDPSKGVSAEYLKLNGLGKVPTFQGSDGFVLSECIAIAIYCECCVFPVCCLGDGFFGSTEKHWNKFLAFYDRTCSMVVDYAYKCYYSCRPE